MSTGERNLRTQLHQPRLAEMVAGVLRQRILDGDLQEGASLPKQEELLEEFRVSKPSIREALRILETEGLVVVRRGKIGGSVVRVPKPENVAYVLGMVLQSKQVGLSDVGAALARLEPLCTGMCAGREDRHTEVVPLLRELVQASSDAIDDELEFTRLTLAFHQQLVARCGNETLILVVGTLESLWAAQEREWASRITKEGRFPERKERQAFVKAHQKLVDLIEKGNVDAALQAAVEHTKDQLYVREVGDLVVDSSSLRGAW
jgi:DNA-binding FadR family transcriptional regulator